MKVGAKVLTVAITAAFVVTTTAVALLRPSEEPDDLWSELGRKDQSHIMGLHKTDASDDYTSRLIQLTQASRSQLPPPQETDIVWSELGRKDQSRVPASHKTNVSDDYASQLIQLTQAAGSHEDRYPPIPQMLQDERMMPTQQASGPPWPVPSFGPLLAGQPPHFAGGPPGARIADKHECKEQIGRHAAHAAYLKSEIRLQGQQNDAWHKIEQAAEPLIEKMYQLCDSLPAGPPNFLTMSEVADKRARLVAELIHAVTPPAQILYNTLSPEQRAVLDNPPMP